MRISWKNALLVPGLLALLCRAQSDDDDLELSSAPPADEFLRRWTPQATIIGNYLYMDSGEISQTVDGEYLRFRSSNPVNETLSLHLGESWDPKDVDLKKIQKDAQPMMRQALFTDVSSDSFYIWAGTTSYQARVSEPKLWRFKADGEGGGSWATEDPRNLNDFTDLKRSAGGAYVSTPDAAFYFGGVSSSTTTPNPIGAVPGFVEFNFTTQTWSNHSTGPWTGNGLLHGGAAVYVPTFGPNGVVMLLGGRDPRSGEYLTLQNVTFMDPVTKDWHWQMTDDTAPPSRIFHCAVGVASPNNTFEIFVYGGRNEVNDVSFDDVYVLSLPGFVWRKAGYESDTPRDSQACVMAGKRQMISFGGINNRLKSPAFWREKDPFPQGLGVFDLAEMEWKSSYDANAADYQAPEAVRKWYDDGGLDGVSWSSSEVEAIFAVDQGDNSSGGSSGGSDNNTGNEGGSSSGSSTPVGAIAGGVVGGVALVALAGVLVWFLRRRRAKQDYAGVQSETTSKEAPLELHGGLPRVEADGRPWKPQELVGSTTGDQYANAVELDATSAGQNTAGGPAQQRYY